jgi:hypothetical protein
MRCPRFRQEVCREKRCLQARNKRITKQRAVCQWRDVDDDDDDDDDDDGGGDDDDDNSTKAYLVLYRNGRCDTCAKAMVNTHKRFRC